MNQETIKAVMSELGRRGGASKSDAKKKAVRKSLAKARKVRWKQAAAMEVQQRTNDVENITQEHLKASTPAWRKPLLKPSQRKGIK